MMQTFLPYVDYDRCATCLDPSRLNKQLVECHQILNVLFGLREGYRNHPAVTMWKGHEQNLISYAASMAAQYMKKKRSTPHGSWVKICDLIPRHKGSALPPRWLGTPELHETHQSRLVHKGRVDIVRKCFTKDEWDEFRGDRFPKQWNQVTPRILDEILYDMEVEDMVMPDLVANHYRFNVSPVHAYIWPDGEGFKTRPGS
jgi:hypothetical protein